MDVYEEELLTEVFGIYYGLKPKGCGSKGEWFSCAEEIIPENSLPRFLAI
jgi:hypothetical protein